jgi:ABC-type molybdate transport system substrate-binding protein
VPCAESCGRRNAGTFHGSIDRPFAKSITDGTCPLYKQLFLVTGPKTLPTAHEFVTFVRSAAGLEVLRQTGHWVI